jgi:hypothetical protein
LKETTALPYYFSLNPILRQQKEANPNNTSKTCSDCGNITDMPLSQRQFNCDICRLQLGRGITASINILKRATLGQRGGHVQVDSVRPRQEAGIRELRADPANAGEAHRLQSWEGVTHLILRLVNVLVI